MLLLTGLLGSLAAAPASASTIAAGFSADPTQDKPITVTVSGSASSARTLSVYLRTSGSCGASPSVEYGQRLSPSGGVAVNGAFSRTYTFTPTSRSEYRICSYLTFGTENGTLDMAAVQAVIARAAQASVAVGFSADPTQDKPVTVTVTGSSEVSRKLEVYVRTSGSCASSPAGEYGQRLSPPSGQAVNGSFSHSYTFTPTSRSAYRICAYVAGESGGTADGATSEEVIPRATLANVSAEVSADPTQDKPVTVALTGSSEVSRKLEVYVRTSGSCSSTPAGEYGQRLSPPSGQAVNGSFAHSYTYTPGSPGEHRICAYVVGESGGTADAAASQELTVRRIQATVGVGVAAAVGAGQSFPVAVAGTAEVSRKLEVYVRTSGSCSSSPAGEYGQRLTPPAGQAVNGSFSQSYSYTPTSESVHRICAYVTHSDGGVEATASGEVRVGNPRDSSPPGDKGGRQPAPVPDAAPANLLLPAAGLVGTLLKPTFTWTSADVARDILVLEHWSGKSFKPSIAVWARGASWVSASDFKDVETLLDALKDPEWKADGWASFLAAGDQATATVRFSKVIAPGRYRWLVFTGRGSESGTLVPSEEREFTVHGPALRNLQVRARSRKGSSTKYPGSTDLRVSVTRYASVRIELRRGGQRSVRNYSAGESSKLTVPVGWSCSKPGGRYRYRVIARDSHGKQLTRSGTFRPVSLARCRAMRTQEQRAKAARQREVNRRVAERRRAEAAAQQGRINRFKSNCRKLGGTPELINSSDGSYWVCVSPWGGTWNVPY